MDQNATWYEGKPRLKRHYVRRGPSSPPRKGAQQLPSTHVYYGQMAGWIRIPLGTEVGLGQGHTVLASSYSSTESTHAWYE